MLYLTPEVVERLESFTRRGAPKTPTPEETEISDKWGEGESAGAIPGNGKPEGQKTD